MTANGLGGGAEYASSYNVFDGVVVGANAVLFPGVPIDPPGNSSSPMTLRFANIRVNANVFTFDPHAPPPPVNMVFTMSGANAPAITNFSQTAGFVAPSLVVTTSAPATLAQCTSAALQPVGTVNIGEGFTTAFKLKGISGAQLPPGAINNTESMLTLNSNTAPGAIGTANFATRFKLRFNNVPSGVAVYVPVSVQSVGPASGQAVLISSESGPFSPIIGVGGVAQIAGGIAIYEIVATNPNAIENFQIPVYVSYGLSPGLGTATVSVSYAPTSTVASACLSCPIPAFADTGIAQNAFSIVSCGQQISASPTSLSFSFQEGIAPPQQSLTVSSAGGTSGFTASSSASWLTVTPSGPLPATLQVSANPNLAAGAYAATITVNATGAATSQITIPVTASVSSASCTYTLLPLSQLYVAKGTTASVALLTGLGCKGTATSDASWIVINSGPSGQAIDFINFTVLANSGSESRTATIGIAGARSSVTQAGRPVTSDTDFVTRLYQYTLGRAPEPAGLAFWLNRLSGGHPRGEVADAFLRSPEYANYGLFIVSCYTGVLGREPELGGYQFWLNRMRTLGQQQLDVINGFLTSPEYQTRFGNPDVSTYVTRLYNNVLGRNPEPEGFQHWNDLLNTGQNTRPEVVQGFVGSPEFQRTTLSQLYANLAYFALLNRTASPAELDKARQAFAGGESTAAFLETIVDGLEFISRPQAGPRGGSGSLVPLFDAYRQFYRQPSEPERARCFLLERFEHNESVIFLAFEGAAAIGFTQLDPSFSSGAMARIFILNDLFVVPQARGRGVGSSLLRAAAAFGHSAGALRLTLSTEVTNTPAQSVYERLGWKRDAVFCVFQLAL